MSCFYCGKRVSLVRRRSDADFCCDDHRQKYHSRARRTIETLREADEQIAVTRRLNEGMPVPPNSPKQGRELTDLMQRSLGAPLLFGWVPTGLPASRPVIDTFVPGAGLCQSGLARRNGTAPPARLEKIRWSIDRVQEGPRPPRAFTISIRLPQGGVKKARLKQTACEGPRRWRTAPPVELGAGARTIVRRIARRRTDNSIAALMRTAKPPAPVKPPPPTPPIVVTLRHATMAVNFGGVARPTAVTVRMPSPGMVGLAYVPKSAAPRPPAPAYVRIERRTLSILGTDVRPGAMPRSHEMRWGNRFVPCPDGFRRRQFYSWELLERFCGMGFETIAGHRPEMPIVAEPDAVSHVAVAHLWSHPIEDASTAVAEPRRPAPPFAERLSLPAGVAPGIDSELLEARPGLVPPQTLDSRHHFPTLATWDVLAALDPVRRQGPPTAMGGARWASSTAEAFGIPAWARPQTRGAKRIACQSGIEVRDPMFAGPAFVAGRRSAGPSAEKPVVAPVFTPPSAQARRETVTARRAAILPESSLFNLGLGQTAILESACRAPVGRIAAAEVVHPAHQILLPAVLPGEWVEMAEGGELRTPPPARQTGVSFDIVKGTPKMVERESLQRFRKRGYESMRSRRTTPRWPAGSTPGLAALAQHPPIAHALRRPGGEPAEVMFRAHDLPAADAFRRACTVMDWRLLPPARPGATDWGRQSHAATVPQPLPLMLPIDSLGPIRDWGLAPPPEPEKPPEPIHEDFSAGLANWLCANADWRQDIAGVRTGSLALLRPSLNMYDYEFEFLCKIENRSIGCVFRAANTSNYHAVQIAVDGAGSAHLARYSMLAGERDQPAIAPLDMQITKSASCRVKLTVTGGNFKLLVNDKPAFDWTDDRLPEGGVGFFSDGEDRARLYWVKVTPLYEARLDDDYSPVVALGAGIHREITLGV
jgi:hypothetical protein